MRDFICIIQLCISLTSPHLRDPASVSRDSRGSCTVWKARFFKLCDVIFLLRLQVKYLSLLEVKGIKLTVFFHAICTLAVKPFAPKLKKCILPNFKKQLYERRSENLYSIITFHLSKLCKGKFSKLRECHICHGTFGDRSPFLAQADQYPNTDHHYADVDPRWRRKDRIDEYYYLIGINECYGDGYTFKIFLFTVDNITKLWIAFHTNTTEISDQPHVH